MTIRFPDENQNSFSIFYDLAGLFEKEYQSEAVKLLLASTKKIRPKPLIDYEADYTYIKTANTTTLLKTLEAIFNLAPVDQQKLFAQLDKSVLKKQFDDAKKNRPLPKEWRAGDVFAIQLIDNNFTLGQVLDKKYRTCVLYDIRLPMDELHADEFEQLRPIAILHLGADLLNNGDWPILFNKSVRFDPASGSGGRFGDVGSRSYGGGGILADLANAWWGLLPWNVMHDENYYDQMLLKEVIRPDHILLLNVADRLQYRHKHFNIET